MEAYAHDDRGSGVRLKESLAAPRLKTELAPLRGAQPNLFSSTFPNQQGGLDEYSSYRPDYHDKSSYPSGSMTSRVSSSSFSSSSPSSSICGIPSVPRPLSPYIPMNPYLITNRTLPSLPHAAALTQRFPYASTAPAAVSSNGSTTRHTSAATSYPTAPQSLGDIHELSTLPDAPHRQAWSSQPTFRWFKRSSYPDVSDRWCEKGPKFSRSRGDNYYRPLSLEEQRQINNRIIRRIETRGYPRLGEW